MFILFKVKIVKENLDSDLDEDIEIDIDEIKSDVILKKETISEKSETTQNKDNLEAKNTSNFGTDDIIKKADENVIKFLTSTDIPTQELTLEETVITDIEKFIHSEFFEGRAVKTPGRYITV